MAGRDMGGLGVAWVREGFLEEVTWTYLQEEKERTLGKGISSSGGTERAKALGWVYTWNVPGNARRPDGWRWVRKGKVTGGNVGVVSWGQIR